MESDRQIILTLQKSLEAEKLRNLNLSAELDLQRNMSLGSGAGANLTGKHEERGFYSSAPGKMMVLSPPTISYLNEGSFSINRGIYLNIPFTNNTFLAYNLSRNEHW